MWCAVLSSPCREGLRWSVRRKVRGVEWGAPGRVEEVSVVSPEEKSVGRP